MALGDRGASLDVVEGLHDEKAEARLASEAAAEAAEIKPEDVSVDAKTQETVAEAKGEA